MKEKLILDIRYFECIDKEKPRACSYTGKIYIFEKYLHYVGQRFARKLREYGFITGEKDHIYIVLNPFLPDREVELIPPRRDPLEFMYYVGFGLKPEAFNQFDEIGKHDMLVEITTQCLMPFCQNDFSLDILRRVKEEILKEKTELEIFHKTKETSKYRVTISYQIRPLNENSHALIEYEDKTRQISGKKELIKLKFYEDIFSLADNIKVANDRIVIEPRKSFKADIMTKRYVTPIQISIDEIFSEK